MARLPSHWGPVKEQDLVNMFMKDEKRTRVRSGICPWVHQGSVPAPQLDNFVPLDKSSSLPLFLSTDVHSRLVAMKIKFHRRHLEGRVLIEVPIF